MKTFDEAIRIGIEQMPAYESILDEIAHNLTVCKYIALFAERLKTADIETVLSSVFKLGVVVGIEMEKADVAPGMAQDLG